VPREEEEESPSPAGSSAEASAKTEASAMTGASAQAGGAGAASSTDVWGGAEAAPAAAAQAQPPARNPFEEEAAPSVPASEFSDAVAVQIPSQVPTGARKPYFIFGDSQNSVDLWFFDLARPAPVQFVAKGSADVAPNDTGDVTGVASYDQGEWSVIFKRPLHAGSGASFAPGQFMPIAFSVWDGFSRERGSRRGLSVWYWLYLGPEEVPSVAGPMIRTALFILVVELIVIGWVRWRHGARARGDLGGEQPKEPATGRA
jgi:hypothetical protein